MLIEDGEGTEVVLVRYKEEDKLRISDLGQSIKQSLSLGELPENTYGF